MAAMLYHSDLHDERDLFAQGSQAGEFVFVTQDARRRDGRLGENQTSVDQARAALENLRAALDGADLTEANLVSLSVFLSDYSAAAEVGDLLRSTFAAREAAAPAVSMVGVCGLEGGCRVRIDALATNHPRRETFVVPAIPLTMGAACHGVRVGDLLFLSGVDAVDEAGTVSQAKTIQAQTREVLYRIRSILEHHEVGLGDLCRTFMFMPGTQYRPGYGEARKEVYRGIFAENEFPPNSGIYICSLGPEVLLRSVAIASRGSKAIVKSPKVREAPGSFSQSMRVGNWLFLAGQDAIGFDRAVEGDASLAGQTETTLRHTRDILEAAGGTMDDIVKTTVYITEGQNRDEFAAAYREFFKAQRSVKEMPTGLTVEVRELAPGCVVEIDAVAFLGARKSAP